MGTAFRFFAVLLAALSLNAAAATARGPVDPSNLAQRAAANERLARRDAKHLLKLVVLPRGSIAARPLKSGVSVSYWTAYTSGIWDARVSLRAAFAFERAHRPRGSRITNPSTLYVHGHASAKEMTFTFPAIGHRVSARQIFVRVARRRSGGTRIGMNASDTWVVVRAADEVVPSGVRTIKISKNRSMVHRVTDPAKVATIIRWFDALRRPSPRACDGTQGPILGASTEQIAFLDRRGHALARAEAIGYGKVMAACYPISFSIGTLAVPPLLRGRFLIRVENLLR